MRRWLQVKWQNLWMRRLADDDFIARLPSSVVGSGMLNEGNKFLFDYAIRRLPAEGAVLEIGSFGGLSMNLMLHLMDKHQKTNPVFSCDPWLYSGYRDAQNPKTTFIDGKNQVRRTDYMEYILESFRRSVNLLHPHRTVHAIRSTSDAFFTSWHERETLTDVFGNQAKTGGKLAFVYIDGDHSLEVSRRDFENTMKYLVPGGFVLFDDSAKGLPYGSVALMDEVMLRTDLKLVRANPNHLFRRAME